MMSDNFKCIYKILRALEAAMDYPEFDFECISAKELDISKERWSAYIEMLSDSGYVKGVVIKKYVDGGKLCDISDMRITLKGLEYLTENGIMQRMYNAAAGIADIIPGM